MFLLSKPVFTDTTRKVDNRYPRGIELREPRINAAKESEIYLDVFQHS